MLSNHDATVPHLQHSDARRQDPLAHAQIQDQHIAHDALVLQQGHDRSVRVAVVSARPLGACPPHVARRQSLQAELAHQSKNNIGFV